MGSEIIGSADELLELEHGETVDVPRLQTEVEG
jgi:hypothetical protein